MTNTRTALLVAAGVAAGFVGGLAVSPRAQAAVQVGTFQILEISGGGVARMNTATGAADICGSTGGALKCIVFRLDQR
ncbi:MAG: hypothetical protein EXQ93_03790 [Alphaproteobacteria bacterium]|nr:hypothetical protein [Alphaproteobacteria bacterium]